MKKLLNAFLSALGFSAAAPQQTQAQFNAELSMLAHINAPAVLGRELSGWEGEFFRLGYHGVSVTGGATPVATAARLLVQIKEGRSFKSACYYMALQAGPDSVQGLRPLV